MIEVIGGLPIGSTPVLINRRIRTRLMSPIPINAARTEGLNRAQNATSRVVAISRQ